MRLPYLLALAVTVGVHPLISQAAPPAQWTSCGSFPALTIDTAEPGHGHRSLSLVAFDGATIACATQDIPVEGFRGVTVRLWALLRGQMAGVKGGLWIRVVSHSRGEEYHDLADAAADLSLDWRPFQLHQVIPQDATTLQVGAIVVGPRGALWVDAMHLDPVPANAAAGRWSPTGEEIASVSAYPANPSFEQ
jgi:hypothetical protein